MTVILRLQMTSPDGSLTRAVFPSTIHFEGELSEASTLEAVFEAEWDLNWNESTTTNVVQLNSYVALYRDSTIIWRGFVKDRQLMQGGAGEQIIKILCLDPIGKLQHTMASLSGEMIFTKATIDDEISNIALVQSGAFGDAAYPFWPTRGPGGDGDPWLLQALNNSTTLDANINNSVQTIVASTSHSGILPAGFIQIDNEWVQYDGYDTSTGSTKYRFKNCTRGALGSTAASHTAGADIDQRVSQKIHPVRPIRLEAQLVSDDSWEAIPEANYVAQIEEGRFDLTYNILNYPAGSTKYDHLRASYGVFDEDDANAISLDDVVADVLQATVINGGPGWAAGEMDVNFDDQIGEPIRITRIRVDEPTPTYEFIRALLDELGLARGTATDATIFFYDHAQGKFIGKTLAQKNAGSEDYVFGDVVSVAQDISLDNVYSAVVVKYRGGVNDNLVSQERTWVPADGTNVGTLAQPITKELYQDVEEPLLNGYGSHIQDYTGNNTDAMFRLFDTLKNTGWGLRCDANPGSACDLMYFYFNDAGDTFLVDQINITLDARRYSHTTNPFSFSCLGIEDYTVAGPASDVKKAIAGGLNVAFDDGYVEQWNNVDLEAIDIGAELQGLCFRWDGMSSDADKVKRYALVKEISVKGSLIKTVLVQLTNNDALGSAFMYAPTSYAKLLDATMGEPRIKAIDVGEMTDNAALSLGRLALLQSLVLEQTREYEICQFPTVPKLGDTVKTQDYVSSGTYTGVVLGIGYTAVAGEETLNLRVVNLKAGLI